MGKTLFMPVVITGEEPDMKLFIIYRFCTFGGVDRVILNRLEAYRKYRMDIKIDLLYLYDYGGLKSLQRYLDSFNLSGYIDIHVSSDTFPANLNINDYDMVLNIDTPSAFEHLKGCKNLFVECHTPYKENRTYLKTLPEYVKAVVVPSWAFRNIISKEVPAQKDIFVLPNSVSEIFFNSNLPEQHSSFNKRPVAYMARLDDLKNIREALKIFRELKSREDVMFIIIGSGAVQKDFVDRVEKAGILAKTVIRSKIHFDQVPQFLAMLKNRRGIFLSPSKGESFGLAVAESIAAQVPVMVSDILPHRDLLSSDSNFLYPQGDVRKAGEKINNILDNWENHSNTLKNYTYPLMHKLFIEEWEKLAAPFCSLRTRAKKRRTFKEAIYKHLGKTNKQSPMYKVYENYALTTNERGKGIVNLVSPYLKVKGKTFLDIGTAYGGYMVAFSKAGCNPCMGIEINENLIALGKVNLEENNLNPDNMFNVDISKPLPDMLKNRKFDIITCADVLEHVSDLPKTFENIKILMSNKGCFLWEIPNRYSIKNVISDPHFGLFGITLLDRDDAIQYFKAQRTFKYDIGEYYGLNYYTSYFLEESYRIKKLWENTNIDFIESDRLLQTEIEMKYQSIIDNLPISSEIKINLKKKFEEYIRKYKKQINNRDVDYFYIPNWRVLICRN
jgi:glycosyltransferase involved in cell wall biosynthesis